MPESASSPSAEPFHKLCEQLIRVVESSLHGAAQELSELSPHEMLRSIRH